METRSHASSRTVVRRGCYKLTTWEGVGRSRVSLVAKQRRYPLWQRPASSLTTLPPHIGSSTPQNSCPHSPNPIEGKDSSLQSNSKRTRPNDGAGEPGLVIGHLRFAIFDLPLGFLSSKRRTTIGGLYCVEAIEFRALLKQGKRQSWLSLPRGQASQKRDLGSLRVNASAPVQAWLDCQARHPKASFAHRVQWLATVKATRRRKIR